MNLDWQRDSRPREIGDIVRVIGEGSGASMNEKFRVISVRAKVRLLSAAESGRTLPIRGSYRPNHNFFEPDSRIMAMGFINLPDGVELNPGESIECNIDFLQWDALNGQIYPGREWRIQEGPKLVGIGTVLSVLSTDASN